MAKLAKLQRFAVPIHAPLFVLAVVLSLLFNPKPVPYDGPIGFFTAYVVLVAALFGTGHGFIGAVLATFLSFMSRMSESVKWYQVFEDGTFLAHFAIIMGLSLTVGILHDALMYTYRSAAEKAERDAEAASDTATSEKQEQLEELMAENERLRTELLASEKRRGRVTPQLVHDLPAPEPTVEPVYVEPTPEPQMIQHIVTQAVPEVALQQPLPQPVAEPVYQPVEPPIAAEPAPVQQLPLYDIMPVAEPTEQPPRPTQLTKVYWFSGTPQAESAGDNLIPFKVTQPAANDDSYQRVAPTPKKTFTFLQNTMRPNG